MKKIFFSGLMMFVFTVLFTPAALAQAKTKTVVKFPVFMAGEMQVVDKNIEGDLMVAGKQVKITADVKGDVYAAGQEIDISGNIGGDLIVAGARVTVSGKISKNLIMAGGQVKVDDSAQIGGYVLTGGNRVDLSGNFSGPVRLGAQSLMMGNKTVINGNFEADVYKSEIASNAKIVGEKNIRLHEVKKVEKQNFEFEKIGYVGKIVSFLSKLIVLLVLVKLFGEKIKKVNLKDSFWSAVGLGLVTLIVVPVASLLLMVTVVAIPLSVIGLIIYFVSLYLSIVIASILIGGYVTTKANFKVNVYFQGVLGLLLVTLVGFIPVVGGLMKFIVLLLGLGIILRSFKTFFRA